MLGTIGGILVVVGTVIGAFDDVFNKKKGADKNERFKTL